MKRILTEEDLQRNPILVELGLKAGQAIEIPEPINQTNESEDDPGGGIEVPKKPPPIP